MQYLLRYLSSVYLFMIKHMNFDFDSNFFSKKNKFYLGILIKQNELHFKFKYMKFF